MPDLEKLYHLFTKNLHYIYLLFALPMVYLTITEIPPFQNADEPNHFARAEQVSRLELVPHFVYDTDTTWNILAPKNPDLQLAPRGGFVVDDGINQLADIYTPLFFQYKIKATQAQADSAKIIHWKSGLGYRNFANTSIYPPFVYLMPALGIIVGKLIHLPIVKTLYAARMLNGALAITLSFIALMLAKRSKILLFMVLLLPMTIDMFSSVSQDAVLISCAFLLIGIIDQIESTPGANYSRFQKYLMVVLVCIISIGKPPYILFSLIFLFIRVDKKTRLTGLILPFVLMICWLSLISANLSIKVPDADLSYNAKLQMQNILHHPFKFISLFFHYDADGIQMFFRMVVGVLGWLDMQLPVDYYHAVYILTFVAFISTVKFTLKDNLKLRIGLFGITLLTLLAVLTAQYLIWTPLYATCLGGMQGRYILPILPFLALALCYTTKEEKVTRFKLLALTAVLLLPVLTSIVLVDGIINRYYWG